MDEYNVLHEKKDASPGTWKDMRTMGQSRSKSASDSNVRRLGGAGDVGGWRKVQISSATSNGISVVVFPTSIVVSPSLSTSGVERRREERTMAE